MDDFYICHYNDDIMCGLRDDYSQFVISTADNKDKNWEENG